MREEMLPFSLPDIGEAEAAAVADAVRSGWITAGPRVAEFEDAFARWLPAQGAIAVSSCTAALHTALVGLGVGPGDEVITSPMTFASSVGVIERVGATPVLADVEPDTLNVSPAAVERTLTPRTRGLLPVHYGGHPADLDALEELASDRGLFVLEDAAHAFPASYRGRRIGSRANPVGFSFYATKNLTTGEGGMLTADPAFIEEVRPVVLHGMNRDAWKRDAMTASWFYEIVSEGYKYNMTDMQAAMGLVQLGRLEEMQRRRRRIATAYGEAFSELDALELPVEREEVEHSWHLYSLKLRDDVLSIDRDRFIREMAERRISTSVHFIPIHLHPFYRDRYGFEAEDFPVAYSCFLRQVSLPLTSSLSDSDVADVIEAVTDVCTTFAR